MYPATRGARVTLWKQPRKHTRCPRKVLNAMMALSIVLLLLQAIGPVIEDRKVLLCVGGVVFPVQGHVT